MTIGAEAQTVIPREQTLSQREFAQEYVRQNRPVVLTGAMEGWRAATWTPQMFAERFGERKVIVSYGKQWRKLSMSALVRVVLTSPVRNLLPL